MLHLSLLGPSTGFEAGYYSVALTVLKPSCLSLPRARMTGLYHSAPAHLCVASAARTAPPGCSSIAGPLRGRLNSLSVACHTLAIFQVASGNPGVGD